MCLIEADNFFLSNNVHKLQWKPIYWIHPSTHTELSYAPKQQASTSESKITGLLLFIWGASNFIYEIYIRKKTHSVLQQITFFLSDIWCQLLRKWQLFLSCWKLALFGNVFMQYSNFAHLQSWMETVCDQSFTLSGTLKALFCVHFFHRYFFLLK